MPEPADSPSPIDPDQPFEEALARLEKLIQGMESDQIPLDDLIRNYEEGTALYQICEKRLDEAQGRVELIRKQRDGSARLESFGEKSGKEEKDSPPNVPSKSDTEFPNADGELF